MTTIEEMRRGPVEKKPDLYFCDRRLVFIHDPSATDSELVVTGNSRSILMLYLWIDRLITELEAVRRECRGIKRLRLENLAWQKKPVSDRQCATCD